MATLIQSNPATPSTVLPPGTEPYTLNDTAAQLLGADATNAANALYAAPNVTPAQASAAVNDLFGAATGSAEDAATAQAQGVIAQGDQAEAQQYLQAAGVADNNARLARVSADLQAFQENRKILKTVGGQISDIAGANLSGPSGTTGIFLQRDSIQQGELAKSLIHTQGEITAGGFEQQSVAAQAEAAAAEAASGAASTLAGQAAATGSMLTANALNNAFSLIDLANTGAGATGGVTAPGTGTGTGKATSPIDPVTGQPAPAPPKGYTLSGQNTRLNASDPSFGSSFQGYGTNVGGSDSLVIK